MEIGFLGLGAMGSRMAKRLVDAGHTLKVWNRTPARAASLVTAGASLADSPVAAARGSEVVLTMLTDDAAARRVWLDPETGARSGLDKGAVAIECSTVTPSWLEELAAALGPSAGLLDAPVAGSRPQAEAGQLIFLVGGASESLERVRPLLEVMGGAVHHCGGRGTGATMKLAVNALFGIQVAALAELLPFLGQAGISPDAAAAMLGTIPVTSPAAKGAAAAIAAKTYAPLFPISLVTKDLRYATDSARDQGCATPTVEAVKAIFEQAELQGYGEDNITGVAQLYL